MTQQGCEPLRLDDYIEPAIRFKYTCSRDLKDHVVHSCDTRLDLPHRFYKQKANFDTRKLLQIA